MLKIEINRGGVITDITGAVRVSGCELNYKFGTDEFKYAPDLMNFSIKVTEIDLINYFLHQHLPVEVLASDDITGFVYFNGYVKPSNNISIEDDYGELNVSCVDSISIDLERPCPKIVDIDNDLQTIAISLVTHAGLQFDFPGEMSSTIVPYFILEEDETDALDALDKLLWEYGWTIYQNHSTSKIVSARSWFHLVDGNDILPGNIFDIDIMGKKGNVIEPLDISEEEIVKQIISVDWIVASNINRVEEEDTCNRGAQLYLHPRSTSEKGVASILAGGVWPADGLLVPTYFRYGVKALPDIIDESRERIKIIHGFNHCVQYVGETDNIVLDLQEHSSKRSRLVFKNNHASKAIRLRGFLIRGSAIYSQGVYTVLGGIYTEPYELISGAVTRSTTKITYVLPNTASDQDNFYIGWVLRSEFGTNVRVTAYFGSTRLITISQPLKVSDQDIAGTNLILVSPDVGLSEDRYEAEHIYNDLDAKRLCLGLINLIEFGRYTYGFELLYDSTEYNPNVNPPKVVSIVAKGTTVYIEYDKLLNPFSLLSDSKDNFGVFEGSSKIISSISVVGYTVILYLAESLRANTMVTVAYSSINSSLIMDREGNSIPFFIRMVNSTTTVRADTQPPELRHTSIIHNMLTLIYNENISAQYVPSGSAFTVTENGEQRAVSNVVINKKRVIVSISPPVLVGTRVYISYEPPVSNALRDEVGNRVDYIDNQWVVNKSILEAQSMGLA